MGEPGISQNSGHAVAPAHGLDIAVFEQESDLAHALATHVLELIEAAAGRGRPFLLGCPGGRTPVSTYRAMGALAAQRNGDLSHLVIVMMDEYLVPGEDTSAWLPAPTQAHYSCARFANEGILAPLNAGLPVSQQVRADHVWIPDPSDPADFDRRIAAAGGIDLFLLASGAGDGHVAFNPPGTPLDSPTRILELAEQTRRDNLATFPNFGDLSQVPSHGISIGLATMARSRAVVMILIGVDKRQAFTRITTGQGYDPQWPATICRVVADARLYADAAAATNAP